MDSLFQLKKIDTESSARTGLIHTGHGDLDTPFFMPVGTYGAVKTQSSDEIGEMSGVLLSNTYHLYLRPGTEILKAAGGLHAFMKWNGAILTDSGGFQIFSLSGLREISHDGVTFQSHLDGSKHHLTPESVVDIQRVIGSDFMMMLDICPPGDADKSAWAEALEQTTRWAKRSMAHFRETSPIYDHPQVILPIVQGGTDPDLRKQSVDELTRLDSDAYAIGGLAVGEPKDKMLDTTQFTCEILPVDKPRYLMGVGTPVDIVKNVARGVDMFDCVMPTRNARNGQLFTFDGKMNIRNAKYQNDFSAIDSEGYAPMSGQYSRAYLHHLFKTKEILGLRIATQHNLRFYFHLMSLIRQKIKDGSFTKWSKDFIFRFEQEDY